MLPSKINKKRKRMVSQTSIFFIVDFLYLIFVRRSFILPLKLSNLHLPPNIISIVILTSFFFFLLRTWLKLETLWLQQWASSNCATGYDPLRHLFRLHFCSSIQLFEIMLLATTNTDMSFRATSPKVIIVLSYFLK